MNSVKVLVMGVDCLEKYTGLIPVEVVKTGLMSRMFHSLKTPCSSTLGTVGGDVTLSWFVVAIE